MGTSRHVVLGRKVRLSALGVEPFRIVGMVADSGAHGLGRADGPRLYYSPAQLPAARFVVLIQGSSNPGALAVAVREAVRGVDPQLPVLELQTLAQAAERNVAQPRWSSALVLSFAIVALGLASVGVYGLAAYMASQRTKECGIRLALGATRLQVCRIIAAQGLTPLAAGLLLGLFGAIGADAILGSYGFLHLAEGQRQVVLAVVAVAVAAMTALACLGPAIRGAKRVAAAPEGGLESV